MRTRHRGLAASLLVLALGATAVAPAVAATPSPAGDGPALTAAAQQLRLPAPSGPYAVGGSTLHVRDTGRTDPYVPEAGGRELLASVFYPA
ncbi:alpha/beta hydrolase, partial [Streptomyces drozdowiczii]